LSAASPLQRSFTRLGSLVLACASFTPRLAAAQAGPPPPAPAEATPTEPAVTLPQPLEIPSAPYPEQAPPSAGDVTVALRLTLDADGRVLEAEVVGPAGHGFDEAARDALLRSRFVPASKNGKPVPAKILFRYGFERPPAAPTETAGDVRPAASPLAASGTAPSPGAAPAVTTTPTGSAAEAPVEPVEVAVIGERSEAETIQRSAAPVTVIQLHRQKKRASDMGEIMARTYGVSIRRSGGLGSDTRFSLNGLQQDQVRFFLNGIPLEHGFPFGVANVPVNLLERVEIYRGVVPVRYASDALGGAVLFVSDQSFENRFAGSYQLGSYGTRRATLFGRYRNEATGFVAGVESYLDSAKNDYEVDVEVPDDRGRLHPATVPRFHDGYRASGVALDAGLVDRPFARRLIVRGLTGAYTKQLQGNLVMTVPYGEVHYGETLSALQLHYEHRPWSKLDVEARGSYGFRTTDFVDKSRWIYDWYGRRVRERLVHGEIEADPTDQTIWQHGFFGRVGAVFRPFEGHAIRLATSSDFTTRTGNERIQANPNSRDPLTAKQDLFKQITGLEYELNAIARRGPRSSVASEGRIAHALQNVAFVKSYRYVVDSEEPLPGGVFRARDQDLHRFGFGEGVRLVLTDWLYVKASYEFATRLPRADEIFGDGVLIHANLELEPEISDNANLGARLELERSVAGDVTLDVNGFLRDTKRQIVLLGNERNFAYQNVYHATSLGVEGSFEWITWWRPLAFDGSATWLEHRNRSNEGTFEEFEGDRIPNRPWLNASFGARIRLTGLCDTRDELEPFYTARYVHEYYRGWESVGLKEFKQVIPSQLTHGAGITYSLRRSWSSVATTLEVQNATNARVFDFYGQERPGRSYFLKVTAEAF
jgi:vitamin B12 transporter